MDLAPVITRLQAQLTGFKSIGASVELDAAMSGTVAMPCAFAMPLAESAVADDMIGRTHQRITQVFGVVLCLSNRRDGQGAAALGDLHPLRLQVRTALVGWVPDAATGEPVHFVAGRLMKMDGDGRLWWLDEFKVDQHYWST